jgi:PhzF family phenazine biosynthesis protein
MGTRRTTVVDVFTSTALVGNPLAVVHDAQGMSDEQMAAYARWTNLSETSFLLPPTDAKADYRLRIFTPGAELPFAGHPTLGSCHAWLAAGGQAKGEVVVQECGVGLVRVRRDGERLAFAAPPLKRSGEIDADTLAQVARALRIEPQAIRASSWVDNGPGWLGVMLDSREQVLALKPDFAAMLPLKIGVVAPWPAEGVNGERCAFEVRAFVPSLGVPEDPVTGSLNAGLAQWLVGSGRAPSSYVASQGTAMRRAGRVHVDRDGDDLWIGGHSVSCIEGTLTL